MPAMGALSAGSATCSPPSYAAEVHQFAEAASVSSNSDLIIDLDAVGKMEEERRWLHKEQVTLHASSLRVPRCVAMKRRSSWCRSARKSAHSYPSDCRDAGRSESWINEENSKFWSNRCRDVILLCFPSGLLKQQKKPTPFQCFGVLYLSRKRK